MPLVGADWAGRLPPCGVTEGVLGFAAGGFATTTGVTALLGATGVTVTGLTGTLATMCTAGVGLGFTVRCAFAAARCGLAARCVADFGLAGWRVVVT
jgi:hypothetical protein